MKGRSQRWFEISDEGLVRRARERPLGRLILEAVQNAFDAGASTVSVDLGPDEIVVVDDAPVGISDERLVYTVFLSDKVDDPTRRGRMGRGLKELLATCQRARVETTGVTLVFGPDGRHREESTREQGTRLVLGRPTTELERAGALELLRLTIPPKGVTLRLDGRTVRRPRAMLGLPSCDLETVVVQSGVERAVMRVTSLSVFSPRRGEEPHLFEMGVPIQRWNVPWHVDVGQRVPLNDARDQAPERFVLAVKATLLEAMLHRYLDRRDLRADWVSDVVARWPVTTALLDAYVSKVFPKGSVLGATAADVESLAADDRARQLGAHIIEAASLSHGAYVALGRVLETSSDFVARRASDLRGEEVEPDATQARFAEAVRWLARNVAGSVVRVRFYAAGTDVLGVQEEARTDVTARIVSFNVKGKLRFDDPLDPHTSGIVLHELAHLVTPEHDQRFVDRLQLLAGLLARRLAEQPGLAQALRSADPVALAGLESPG
jgi:hypothetical protein